MITIDEIAKSLSEGQLAVFVGAGVSRSYANDKGIPLASEFVKIFASKFKFIANNEDYINGNLRFEVASKIIKDRVGDKELLEIICSEINQPCFKPLQAHRLLAKLPFNSYFMVNFDRLLEQAYSNITNKFHVIIKDEDVAFWKSTHTPIVKLHGCISDRSSIVAAIDDYKPFKRTKPLIDSFTRTFLASKRILFLGFSLNDPDFIELYTELKKLLGRYMSRHMAVVRDPRQEDITKWDKMDITIEDRDLTDFLNELASRESHVSNIPSYIEQGKSAYLSKLHEVTDCPTETIAIDVFLELLKQELDSQIAMDSIIEEFRNGYKAVLHNKPNFLAFKNECDEIVESLDKCSDKNEMKSFLYAKETERRYVTYQINIHNSKVIKASAQILLYSQSVRVIEFLKSLPVEVQRSCILYVSECRVKCPSPFYDSIQIKNNLSSTQYQICMITDSSISYLMKTNQINCVIMGAHAVYKHNGRVVKFVNTSGTEMILNEAEKYNIPVFIIAEKKKTKEWTEEAAKETKFEEGNFITKCLLNYGDARVMEIAYDLCQRTNNIRFVSEDGIDE